MLRQLAASLAIVALVAPLGCGPGSKPQPARPGPTEVAGPGTPGKTEPGPVAKIEPGPAAKVEPGPAAKVEPGKPVKAKALDQVVKKGLGWLASAQLDSGGWGQGDEAQQLRPNEPRVGMANVADTSMALLAFIRAGNTPQGGDYKAAVAKGLGYIMSQIEASDGESLYVSSVRGTRVQAKIGQYVDTFAALMVLTEARNKMADAAGNARLDAALKKVVKKVERNQRENGSWDEQGWAPVLSQALAAKGMNRAAQGGTQVSKQVLERIEAQAKGGALMKTGGAGVTLYGDSASTANIRDVAETKKAKAVEMKAKAKKFRPSPMLQSPDAPTPAEIAAAEAEATRATAAAIDSERALIRRLDDASFIAGFGNNGGEEFLSYLLISETLVQTGGEEWAKWDAAISKLVGKVQNADGSWTGHHCITGRTFCTAAALLVLMGDRTPAAHNVIATG